MKSAPGGLPLARLSEFLETHMALCFDPPRWKELEFKISRAAKELGYPDGVSFVKEVLSSGATTERMEVLAGYLTTGETFFWREPALFENLETRILPKLAEARSRYGPKTLRLWSAGCSSGEEPYSLAIAIRRFLPDMSEWKISILATDINPDKIRNARAGLYGKWSFRNAPAWLAKDYFTERTGGDMEISPDLRGMVSFEYLNLSDDIYPSALNDTQAMDIILCRNVLMYFRKDRAREIVGRFHRALNDSGCLAVAACEHSLPVFSDFKLVPLSDSPVYAKHPAFPGPAADQAVRPPKTGKPAPKPAAERVAGKSKVSRPKPVPPLSEEEILALADQGKLSEALSACASAIDADKVNPRLHFLKASILQEMNRETEAADELRRVIFLEPGSLSAHYCLGNLFLRNAETEAARRSFRNTLELLDDRAGESILAEVGGLTVNRFRLILEKTMAAASRKEIADAPGGGKR